MKSRNEDYVIIIAVAFRTLGIISNSNHGGIHATPLYSHQRRRSKRLFKNRDIYNLVRNSYRNSSGIHQTISLNIENIITNPFTYHEK
jgi:hypothetical protein